MDRNEVEAIVRRHLTPLCERFGLERWEIKVTFNLRKESGDHQVPGECHRLYDYEKVSIELDPEWFDDEAEVLKVLRHELLHLVASPFDLFAAAVEKLSIDESAKDVLDRVWTHAQEMTVVNLERFFSRMTKAQPQPEKRPVAKKKTMPKSPAIPKADVPKPAKMKAGGKMKKGPSGGSVGGKIC